MSVVYEKIDRDLKKRKKDVMFSPSMLNDLDETERKDVEKRIVLLCLYGETACFKYLSFLKYYSPKEIFNEENLSKLPINKQVSILKVLFVNTNDNEYLNRLLKLSSIYLEAYSELVLMYHDGKYNNNIKESMFDILKKLSFKNPKYYNIFKIIDSENTNTFNNDLKFSDIEQKMQHSAGNVTLKSITGKELTRDDIASLVEYSNSSSETPFVDNFDDYYEKDGVIIKFVSSKDKAYKLVNNTWIYSDEATIQLKANKECYPRKYNFYENFPYEGENKASNLFNNFKDCKYIRLSDNRISKVDLKNNTIYVFNEEDKCWQEIPSLYADYCYGNISYSEIQFEDNYPIAEKKRVNEVNSDDI